MGFYEVLALAARVTQAIFSLIVLGTCGYGMFGFVEFLYIVLTFAFPVVSQYSFNNGIEDFHPQFPQANFMIFVAVWSLLVVGYQIAVPRFSDKLGHKFIVLGLDALTALFWFAGFIALSVAAGSLGYFSDGFEGVLANWYHTLQAACAFGAFAW